MQNALKTERQTSRRMGNNSIDSPANPLLSQANAIRPPDNAIRPPDNAIQLQANSIQLPANSIQLPANSIQPQAEENLNQSVINQHENNPNIANTSSLSAVSSIIFLRNTNLILIVLIILFNRHL